MGKQNDVLATDMDEQTYYKWTVDKRWGVGGNDVRALTANRHGWSDIYKGTGEHMGKMTFGESK